MFAAASGYRVADCGVYAIDDIPTDLEFGHRRRWTWIYRFYDDLGRLLYVGISNRPGRRLTAHSRDSAWFCLAGFVEVALLQPPGQSPLDVERCAVQEEEPLYNVEHRSGVARRAAMTRRDALNPRGGALGARDPVEVRTAHERNVASFHRGRRYFDDADHTTIEWRR